MYLRSKQNRSRTISISDDLWNKIKKECDDCISVSKFIRMCVEERIYERFRKEE